MKFLLVLFVWLVMAAVITAGILLAVKGTLWLLVVAGLAFVVLFSKYGCLSHH